MKETKTRELENIIAGKIVALSFFTRYYILKTKNAREQPSTRMERVHYLDSSAKCQELKVFTDIYIFQSAYKKTSLFSQRDTGRQRRSLLITSGNTFLFTS